MGGPGGAGSKPNLSYFASEGAPYRKEDFYSVSACVNCHQSIPQNTCTTCHSKKPVFSSTLLPRPSPCNAEMRWPDFLQEGIPKIQQYPWWIDQNFLTTQLQKPGTPINPEKIDFGIEIFLRAGESFQVTDYRFETQKDAKVIFTPHLAGRGENLSILLEGQTLLALKNIRVKPEKWFGNFLPNNWLQEVGIKDGHPFLRAAIGALNLFRNSNNPSYSDVDLQEFILPKLPIAYDSQNGKIYLGEDYEDISRRRGNTLQKIETTYEIYESKQFPQLIKLSEIFKLIGDFSKISELKKEDETEEPPSALERAVDSIVFKLQTIPDEIKYPNFLAKFHRDPNNTLSLKVETKGLEKIERITGDGQVHLDELFIPGLLHLEDSQANLHVSYLSGQESTLDLDDIHASLRPLDYFKSNPRKLGCLQILEGEIQDGKALQYMGFDFPPGIHIRQLGNGNFQIQANLSLHLKFDIPVLGTLEINAPLVFQTEIVSNPLDFLSSNSKQKKSNQGLKIVPESTLFYIPELEIQTGKNPIQSYSANLLLTDIPHLMMPTPLGVLENGFWMSANIHHIENAPFQYGLIETFIPLETNLDGSYDFEDLTRFIQLNSLLDFNLQNGDRISGSFDLIGLTNDHTHEVSLRASLDQQDAKTNKSHPLVSDLFFQSVNTETNSSSQRNIILDATSFSLGPISLQNPHFHLAYSGFKLEDDSLVWNVQDFKMSANQKTPPFKTAGILRGPFMIRNTSKPEEPLQIAFNPSSHLMQISNLGLAFDIKRITIPGIIKLSERAISGIDLDGKIQGHWNFDTETYAGKGKIIIRGDKEGDIHFRGKNGRRLEDALDPNDPQRFYQIPLLANTRFVVDRIQAFDSKSEQVKGHFHLSTLVDWLALKALGIQWNEHDEFTFDFDHLPYSAKGYAHKIREFFRYIASHPSLPIQKEVKQ